MNLVSFLKVAYTASFVLLLVILIKLFVQSLKSFPKENRNILKEHAKGVIFKDSLKIMFLGFTMSGCGVALIFLYKDLYFPYVALFACALFMMIITSSIGSLHFVNRLVGIVCDLSKKDEEVINEYTKLSKVLQILTVEKILTSVIATSLLFYYLNKVYNEIQL
jgi:hypothetical protein